MLLVGALVFTPVWLFLAKALGKRNAWLLWSFTNGLTFLCFAPVGSGDVYLCIIMSLFNGAPMGGKFLADAIMADVIDYDEFLTGARAEATYTMFKGFLPKIAAIPASAVPIALLSTFGHKPPVNGNLVQQTDGLKAFIVIVIVYIPSALSFFACLIKMRFPLTTERQNELIQEGVARHMVGKQAPDPCSGKLYQPVVFDEEDQKTVDLLGNFPGTEIIQDFIDDVKGAAQKTHDMAIRHMVISIVWLFVFGGISMGSFNLLLSEKESDVALQFIPVLAIVGFGAGITLIAFAGLRLQASHALVDHKPTDVVLQKLLVHREELAKLRNFDTSYRHGCSTHPKVPDLEEEKPDDVELQTTNVNVHVDDDEKEEEAKYQAFLDGKDAPIEKSDDV